MQDKETQQNKANKEGAERPPKEEEAKAYYKNLVENGYHEGMTAKEYDQLFKGKIKTVSGEEAKQKYLQAKGLDIQ